jgi:transposase
VLGYHFSGKDEMMQEVFVVGLDLAKNVFQAHGADAEGTPLFSRKLRRAEVLRFFEKTPRCLVGMEACGGAHYWAREIAALGHDVRLIPPAYVTPFVKRGKTDAGDAEAISEAVVRKTMRFVPIKTAEQQAANMVLKTRTLLVRQRTQAINALRAHLGELGIIAGTGVAKIDTLIAIVRDKTDVRLPSAARFALTAIVDNIEVLKEKISKLEDALVRETKLDEDMRRLVSIPGIGAITAATIKALVPDPGGFKSARHFASWIGLTPKPRSSGGKERLGRISKMGNPDLRSLLVVGATSVLRYIEKNAKVMPWLTGIIGRRPYKVAAVALANKMARIAWALLTQGGVYQKPIDLAARVITV